MKKGGIIVVYIGDYFAIALVGVVFLFFLEAIYVTPQSLINASIYFYLYIIPQLKQKCQYY